MLYIKKYNVIYKTQRFLCSASKYGHHLLLQILFGFHFKVELQYLNVMNNVKSSLEPMTWK